MTQPKWIDDLGQDVRYGLRTLAKSPGFLIIATLTLALGIGANTALFSVIDAILLKPLPFRSPDKIVALWQTEAAPGSYPLTGEDYFDWRTQNSTFEDMSLYSWPRSYNLSGAGGTQEVDVVRTEANFFALLGVGAEIGRTFGIGEDQKGGSRLAVLSYGFWNRHFGALRECLGKPLELNGESYTVIGVLPAWYRLPGEADVWLPLDMSIDKLGRRGSHRWRAIGRVKEDLPISKARADLRTIAERLEKEFPDTNRHVDAIVTPMRNDLIGDFENQLWMLFGGVTLVLAIACTNVANLLLARATGRRQEMVIRRALGAGRDRLSRQLLTEGVLLSCFGGTLGVVMAFGVVAILRVALPETVPRPNPIQVGLAPLSFAFVTCIVVGILFGLAPALQLSKSGSGEMLNSRSAAIGNTSKSGQWLKNMLAAGEIALALTLLIGAGLLLRTFVNLRTTDVGVKAANVLTARLQLPQNRYRTIDERRKFFDELLDKLQTSRDVEAAAITTELPLQGGNNGYIEIPGQQTEGGSGSLVEEASVSENYFRALTIPLLAGREFEPADYELTAQFVRDVTPTKANAELSALLKKYTLPAIINQTMARTFWPGQDSVGKVFEHFARFQVIGVVGDVKQDRLTSEALPQAYYPLTWGLEMPIQLIAVKGFGSSGAPARTMRAAVQSLDPDLAVMHLRTISQIIAESMMDTTYEMGLLGGMAALALFLAAAGTFGVMSHLVGQRTNELGIRIALGARRIRIFGIVLKQGATIIVIGIVTGLVGAVVAAKLLEALLVGVKPLDPATYAGGAGLLVIVGLAACYLPARRATRVDPMRALKYE